MTKGATANEPIQRRDWDVWGHFGSFCCLQLGIQGQTWNFSNKAKPKRAQTQGEQIMHSTLSKFECLESASHAEFCDVFVPVFIVFMGFQHFQLGSVFTTFRIVTNWLSGACETHASPNAIRIAWHNFAMTWSAPQKTAGICQTLKRSLSPLQPLKFRGSGQYSNELGNMDVRMQRCKQFMWIAEHHTASLFVWHIIYLYYTQNTIRHRFDSLQYIYI